MLYQRSMMRVQRHRQSDNRDQPTGSVGLGAGDTDASKNVAKACLGGARVTLAARLPNGFRSTSSFTHQPCLSQQIHPLLKLVIERNHNGEKKHFVTSKALK